MNWKGTTMGFWVVVLLLFELAVRARAQELPPPPAPPQIPVSAMTKPSRARERPLPLPTREVAIQRYELKAGWNLVSFPFTQVVGSRGFSALVDAQGRVVHDSDLRPGCGYWTHAAVSGRALAWGAPLNTSLSIGLQPGWNLLGNGYEEDVEWAQLSGFEVGGQPFPLLLSSRLGPVAYGSQGALALGQEGAALESGAAYWVYAHSPLELHMAPGQLLPRLQAFRSRGDGKLALQVENLPAGPWQIVALDASNRCSDFSRESGDWLVFRALNPEGSFLLQAGPCVSKPFRLADFRPTPRQLTLQVVSEDGEPISRAQVRLAGRAMGSSDRNGRLLVVDPETDQPVFQLSCPGFLRRQVRVPLGKAARQSQKVLMYSPRTSLWFRVFPSSDGFRATRIDIYRKHDFSERLWQTYTFEGADPYIDFTWGQVRAHLNYVVEITWTDAQGTERWHRFERKMPASGLQEYIYDYWTTR